MSKEFLLETAQARNKIALPRVLQNEWGIRLPSERFVLSGVPWSLRGEWAEEEEATQTGVGDSMEGLEVEGGMEAEEGEGNMDDLFGAGADEDLDMDREE